jgi:mycofactocin precursor
MAAGSMVTRIALRPYRHEHQAKAERTRIRRGPYRRFVMQQDIRAGAAPARTPSCVAGAGLGPGQEPGADDPEITGELLVEEVSIDGMCGVY